MHLRVENWRQVGWIAASLARTASLVLVRLVPAVVQPPHAKPMIIAMMAPQMRPQIPYFIFAALAGFIEKTSVPDQVTPGCRAGTDRHGPDALDQAAVTSIILGVAARGAGTRTSSMPFADLASTRAASTPSGRAMLRWNAP